MEISDMSRDPGFYVRRAVLRLVCLVNQWEGVDHAWDQAGVLHALFAPDGGAVVSEGSDLANIEEAIADLRTAHARTN